MMKLSQRYKECADKLIKELEEEFLRVIEDPKLDKKQKNLLTKPLVTKKQILLNAYESLVMVEEQEGE